MSAIPERSNLTHMRQQARELLRQYRAHDPVALASFRRHLPAAKDKSDTELSTMPLRLRDAQSCVARQYGFRGWHKLKHYVQWRVFTAGAKAPLVADLQRSNAQTSTSPDEAALEQRIKDNTASPGTEAALRSYIAAWERGRPSYEDMSPGLARLEQRQRPAIENRMLRVGALKALSFKGVDRFGNDVYEALFAQGQIVYRIAPLAADGKVTRIASRQLLRSDQCE